MPCARVSASRPAPASPSLNRLRFRSFEFLLDRVAVVTSHHSGSEKWQAESLAIRRLRRMTDPNEANWRARSLFYKGDKIKAELRCHAS